MDRYPRTESEILTSAPSQRLGPSSLCHTTHLPGRLRYRYEFEVPQRNPPTIPNIKFQGSTTAEMTLPMAGANTGLGLSVIAIACAIAALVVSSIISTARSYRRLQDFKGPTLGYFTDLWVFKATVLGNLNQQTSAVLKQHGRTCPSTSPSKFQDRSTYI